MRNSMRLKILLLVGAALGACQGRTTGNAAANEAEASNLSDLDANAVAMPMNDESIDSNMMDAASNAADAAAAAPSAQPPDPPMPPPPPPR